MLSVPKFFIFIYSIATLGYTQKVDLSTHKDLILKLHNGYRGLQGASNMKKLVCIFYPLNFRKTVNVL